MRHLSLSSCSLRVSPPCAPSMVCISGGLRIGRFFFPSDSVLLKQVMRDQGSFLCHLESHTVQFCCILLVTYESWGKGNPRVCIPEAWLGRESSLETGYQSAQPQCVPKCQVPMWNLLWSHEECSPLKNHLKMMLQVYDANT